MKSLTRTIVLSVVGVIAFIVTVYFVQYETAPLRGKVQEQEQLESGSNRIQQYQDFFDLCANVQTEKQTLKAQQHLLKTIKDSGYRERIQTNITALQSSIANDVNQYNARSHMYTTKRFKDSQLPYTLSVNGPTYCIGN